MRLNAVLCSYDRFGIVIKIGKWLLFAMGTFLVSVGADAVSLRNPYKVTDKETFAKIQRVTVQDKKSYERVILDSNVQVRSWTYKRLSNPARLVITLPRTTYQGNVLPKRLPGTILRDIRLTKDYKGTTMTLFFTTEGKVSHTIARKGETLQIQLTLASPAAPPTATIPVPAPAPKPPPPPVAPPPPAAPAPTLPPSEPSPPQDLYGSIWEFIPGFVEYAMAARRVPDNSGQVAWSLAEGRVGFDLSRQDEHASLRCRYDFEFDATTTSVVRINFRDLHIAMNNDWMDFKIGRFVSTWGTGDFVFLNDLFHKDWESFFLGREDDYLKNPTNTMRFTFFSSLLNLDTVVMPIFEPDVYIDSPRFTFWDPMKGDLTTFEDPETDVLLPDKTTRNAELAGRVYRNIAGWEWAGYGYYGRYHQPVGFVPDDPMNPSAGGLNSFPRLRSLGASVRGTLMGSVVSAEASAHRSMDDPEGTDPYLPNSEDRWLVGWSFEPLAYNTLGFQFYEERLRNMDAPTALYRPDAARRWLTMMWMGRLPFGVNATFFGYYSPNEKDFYIRPRVSWRFTDELTATVGANVWGGREEYTFFGQFTENDNVYVRMRYSF